MSAVKTQEGTTKSTSPPRNLRGKNEKYKNYAFRRRWTFSRLLTGGETQWECRLDVGIVRCMEKTDENGGPMRPIGQRKSSKSVCTMSNQKLFEIHTWSESENIKVTYHFPIPQTATVATYKNKNGNFNFSASSSIPSQDHVRPAHDSVVSLESLEQSAWQRALIDLSTDQRGGGGRKGRGAKDENVVV